ncbi:MAG TPA: HAD-IB family phosphatase [Candidatus Acidoferrum sp.]|nr:HAD-IB family phosphatase [Candidatus Acidoferrum sp.]
MNLSASTAARVGAFFDIDGTLLPPPSLEWRFLAFLLAHDDIGSINLARWLGRFLRLAAVSPHVAATENKVHLRDLPESLADMWQRSLFCHAARPGNPPAGFSIFAEALTRMEWHVSRGHRIFLVSGTLAPLARIVASHLSQEFSVPIECRATEIASRHSTWTGELAGPHISGKEKARTIAELAACHTLSLADSFAYANGFSDLPALAAVGHPVMVNPSHRLAHAAATLHWPVVRWSSPPAARGVSFSVSARIEGAS